MRVHSGSFVVLFFLSLGLVQAEDQIVFNRDIRPILSEKCFFCHGPDAAERKAGLRLDLFEGATQKLRSGERAIVPGDLDASETVYRIRTDDEDDLMPPQGSHKTLSEAEKNIIEAWIRQGAEYQEHWSFIPPRKTESPKVKKAAWPVNWIDRYILHRLEQEGIAPSPEADRVTLLRRLQFDLVGLPPGIREVDAFLNDKSPEAYEKQVDRLLASKHYGERMAMHWLDLVRYADTVGYHGDQDHSITPYRDYVIEAFNTNRPQLLVRRLNLQLHHLLQVQLRSNQQPHQLQWPHRDKRRVQSRNSLKLWVNRLCL
ncbi:MAG: DUF1549 domain-containing protein, partial [Verrucomicrobiota bacterium]